MSTSAARIAANQANAQHSTGPKTPEGKEASRANGTKHGLTGQGIVVPQADAATIAERARRMRAQMRPVTEVGGILIDRMAMLSVRFDHCYLEESERLAAMNDGEGGLIDLSKEGQFAFRYDQATQRNFHKAHDEYRRVEAEAKANGIVTPLPAKPVLPPLGSSCAEAPVKVFGLEPIPARPLGSSCEKVFSIEPPAPPIDPKPSFTPTRQPNPPGFTNEVMPFGSGWKPDGES